MDCNNCFLHNRTTENKTLKSPVCDGNLQKPRTEKAFANAVTNSGLASVCRCSPFRTSPYRGDVGIGRRT